MSAALDAAREALRDERAWLVGGAVRDRLLGREIKDVDVVLDAPRVKAAARHLAMQAGGPAFELSDAFGAWRVVAPDRSWQVDLIPIQAETIEDDLAQRDFTVNALAEPLEGGQLVDPTGGVGDLEERRLRMVAPASFDADPLRVLRLARFACELGLEPDPETVQAAAQRAARIVEVAPERVFAELRRVVTADEAVAGLALMEELALTPHVLPELTDLHGVEQNRYHHRDVHGHTVEVLEQAIALERDPVALLGPQLGEEVAAFLAEPLSDELTRAGGLRLGALLHDAAKPATRAETETGSVTFYGHDRQGAEMARAALTRLRTSERLRAHVAALARHHLRLGFLVHHAPLDRRAVHAYLVACGPVEVDVTLLSIADRLATRGRKHEEAIARHLDLALLLLRSALDWRRDGPPEPLLRGKQIAKAVGIEPGPGMSELVAELQAAQYAGEVTTADEAAEHLQRWHAGR